MIVPSNIWDYFTKTDRTILVDIARLHCTRMRLDGIANARRYMDEAAKGLRDRRVPIAVVRRDDGDFDIQDGNSTYHVATDLKWTHLPVEVADGSR